jgi:hypothetical protein
LLASPSRQLLRRRSSALGQDRRCCRAGARALPPRNQSPWASWVFGLAQRAACIRQELALRARDRPRCGHPGSARSVWHQFGINRWLAPWTAVPGPRGGFVPDDQRDEARACSGGWLARAWPLQRASLRRNRARRPRFYHGGIRRAHLSDRHPCSLQSCQLACAAELPSDQCVAGIVLRVGTRPTLRMRDRSGSCRLCSDARSLCRSSRSDGFRPYRFLHRPAWPEAAPEEVNSCPKSRAGVVQQRANAASARPRGLKRATGLISLKHTHDEA